MGQLTPEYYLSIVLENTDSFSTIIEVVKRAEELGYCGLGIGEHYPTSNRPKWQPDPFVVLASLTQTVRKLKLGTLASSTSTRHPMVLANSAKTLYNLGEGRFFLCLGVGSGKDEEYSANGFPYVSSEDRLQVFEETLAIIRGLSSPGNAGASFTFDGKYYSIRGSIVLDTTLGGFPPVWVGERHSKRVLKLAGMYANALNMHCNSVEHAKKKMDLVRGFAEEAGRPKESVDAVIKHFVIFDKDEDLVAEKLGYSELKLGGESPSAFIERQRKESPDAIVGTLDEVKAEYESYIDAGFEKFTPILLPNTVDKISAGMELFARILL
jgi:alkanesulfonate monooxygenase SsuD/methylene tetrahydromethanopterin reductase-like flavin-dependent oxidoreductase (luciferase family)